MQGKAGTAQWREAHSAARAQRTAQRIEALREAGIAQCDAPFAGYPAPSGIGERIERRGIEAVHFGAQRRHMPEALRIAHSALCEAQAHSERQAVLSMARAQAGAQRAAQRASEALVSEAHSEALREDWLRRSEHTAVERRYAHLRRERIELERLMAGESDNDGRQAHETACDAESVNGAQVRAGERWQVSAPAALAQRTRADGSPFVSECRSSADGGRHWRKLTPELARRRRKRSAAQASSAGALAAATLPASWREAV